MGIVIVVLTVFTLIVMCMLINSYMVIFCSIIEVKQ